MAMRPEFHDRLPAIWMITAAFCFASMGALAHAVGPRCDWLVIALVRIVCSFVFSVALAWMGGARLVLLHAPHALDPQHRRDDQPGLHVLRPRPTCRWPTS